VLTDLSFCEQTADRLASASEVQPILFCFDARRPTRSLDHFSQEELINLVGREFDAMLVGQPGDVAVSVAVLHCSEPSHRRSTVPFDATPRFARPRF
jgi:hypothetical protein